MIVLQKILMRDIYHRVNTLDDLRDNLIYLGKVGHTQYYVGDFGDIYLTRVEDVDSICHEKSNEFDFDDWKDPRL